MGFSTTTNVIERLFKTGWGTTTPICYDNVPFTVPDNANWVQLSIVEGPSTKASIGSAPQLRRSRGMVGVILHIPLNTGTVQGKLLMDQAATIFRDVKTSGITFMEPAIGPSGNVQKTAVGANGVSKVVPFYAIPMAVPYIYDHYL